MNPRRIPAALLAAALVLFCAAPLPAAEFQVQPAPSGHWMCLLQAGSVDFLDTTATTYAESLGTGFIASGNPAAPAETGHAVTAVYNTTGVLILLKFDGHEGEADPGGDIEFYLGTDASAAAARTPVRHFTIHAPEAAAVKMVPEYSGACVPVEERERPDRTRRYMTEDAAACGPGPTGPLNRKFNVQWSKARKCWYVSVFLSWPCFALELPFFQPNSERGAKWRLKIVRHAPGGAKYTWGTDDIPFSGYGTMKWPRFGQDTRVAIYRQLIIDGIGGAGASVTGNAREYWRISPKESAYGFLKADTFQPREADSDTLFLNARLQPFFDGNAKMIDALAYTPEKGAKALDWPVDEKDRFFSSEIKRLYSVRDDIAQLRRQYLLDRFLGREVKVPEKKAAPRKAAIDPGDFDSIDAGGNAIELDDEAFF